MPNTQPKFTLATITSNNAKGIEKTWNSIEKQDFKDFEWLVQDDVSSDNTQDLLKNTSAQAISEADNGIYDAMNRLVERANGEYIIFLNAGDTLANTNTLSTINKHTEKNPAFLYGDALEGETHKEQRYKTAKNHKTIYRGMFTHHQSMIYKTSEIGNMRYNETYKIAADYDFTARFLQNAQTTNETTKYIPEPFCIFEPGGISQTQIKIGRDEQFKIRKTLNLCAPLQNHAITMLQAINMTIREHAPNLYWSLRRH